MIRTTSSSGLPTFEKSKKTKRHFTDSVDVSKFDTKLPPRIKRMLKKLKQQQVAE